MNVRTTTLPKKFHDAIVRWKDEFIPDYDYLLERWDTFFPNDRRFELCAFRELGICEEIECGSDKGKPKRLRATELAPEQAGHLLGAIRAQASTEFGSIQQHRLTLARAQDEEEQFWVLRMMAEELRHGYQMIHLLVEDDWSAVTEDTSADMVEEILSMNTGSHVLGAFNIEFDSFIDNVVFCALIDRVGKYQLSMQRISAYKPMAESMPQMLREEAFHLATGVVPMRRWATRAASGEGTITMAMLQKAVAKWLPRGLEMFGDERGGGTNVRYGLKPMKNAEAQRLYYEEVAKLVADVNTRFVRARLPDLDRAAAIEAVERLTAGDDAHGLRPEDVVHMPHQEFFRRRGVPAFTLVGFGGEPYQDVDAYADHLRDTLPEAYLAGCDFLDYLDLLRKVAAGELTADEAGRRAPNLRRVGGSCPCSRAVRWVIEDPAAAAAARTARTETARSAGA